MVRAAARRPSIGNARERGRPPAMRTCVPMAQPKRAPGATRAAVAALLQEGHSLAEIARRLGVSKPTASYHARALGIPIDARANRRYDWAAVQAFYDAGNSISACQAQFGMARATFGAAVRRGQVVTRPQAMPLEQLLARPRNRQHVKQRLIQAGLKDDACEQCGIARWRGAPLAIELHHRNGDPADNRLENLQLLCPNCHSQTDTFAGRRRPPGAQAAA
ncbi:helix-turn-helix domain-containing protein [Conexibacter sp. W3-3-2]|nr:helix-turn-helix domain-containing protein [Conexibacter sp. W3-3-2]